MNSNSKSLSMHCLLTVENILSSDSWAEGSIALAVSVSSPVTLWEDSVTEIVHVKSGQQKRDRLDWWEEKVKDERTRAVRAEWKAYGKNEARARGKDLQSRNEGRQGQLLKRPLGRRTVLL